MFAYFHRHRLILPIAPALGGMLGLLFALVVALVPGEWLDRLVSASGIPSILPAAAPPLAMTARALLVLFGGGGIALLAGAGLYCLFGRRAVAIGRHRASSATPEASPVPVLRRADAHPDAPARRPVFAARDLGTPLLDVPVAMPERSVEAETTIPVDLDLPLSAYDPAAILSAPREPVHPVASLARIERPQLIDPDDRFETFELTPLVRDRQSSEDTAAPAEAGATIHALLDRLERGVSGSDRVPPAPRAAAKAGDGLQDALGTLRRLAAGGAAA